MRCRHNGHVLAEQLGTTSDGKVILVVKCRRGDGAIRIVADSIENVTIDNIIERECGK